MLETDVSKARRSTRVFMRVRVVVAGKNSDGRRFREACETVVINAHGGLMYLNQPLNMDAILVITNPFTQEEQECIHVQGLIQDRKSTRLNSSHLGISYAGFCLKKKNIDTTLVKFQRP